METIQESKLQKMRIEATKVISQHELDFINELNLHQFMMESINGLCWNLHGWVWAGKSDRKEVITGTIEIPATWFEALKATLIVKYHWLVKYLNVRYTSIEVKREIDLQTFYPTMKILNHEPYLNVVEVNNASERID